MIITIDGPAGTGKSTVAKCIADKLGFSFFDTGAMYRAVTWLVLKKKIAIHNEKSIEEMLEDFHFSIQQDKNEKKYYVNGMEITRDIRTPEVNRLVSEVSALEAVRKAMVKIQRDFAINTDSVFEGRDMGTVVFPKADCKIFLDADPLIRAQRRYKEYIEKHPELSLNKEEVLKEVLHRDKIDSSRKISPLKQAEDAHFIDTSFLTIEEVVQIILSYMP